MVMLHVHLQDVRRLESCRKEGLGGGEEEV